jgi:GntR family transcriptional regulator, transcriptional repressor for pyruvate dehydrogenase complex
MSNSGAAFMPIKTRRAFDDIIDQIREQLRAGALKPGDKLPSERDFAVQLGVSRNTVREAVRMLEIAGLVTLKKGATGGAFITSDNTDALTQSLIDGLALSNFSIADLVNARIALETTIARQAATEVSSDDIAELRDLVGEAQSYDGEREWALRLKAHVTFEERLAEMAGNPLLKLLDAPLLDLTSAISLRIGPSVDREIWDERADFLDALARRDGDRAARIVRDYLELMHEKWLGYGSDEA